MKKIYTLLVVVLCFSGNAQIVNIPDPLFKSELIVNNGIDTNADGEIQVSEAEAVGFLYISNVAINSFEGIQSFTGLYEFYIFSGSNITANSLDLSASTGLYDLRISDCTALTSVILNSPSINSIRINNCSLNSIDISTYTSLQNIELVGNSLTTIDLPSSMPSLQNLFLGGNQFSSIILPSFPSLINLDLSYNQLTSINFSPLSVENIDLRNNQITTFNTTIDYAETLYLGGNPLTSVNFSEIHNVRYLYLNNISSSSIDFTGYALGSTLSCSGPNLTYVKIPEFQFSSASSFNNTVSISGPNLNVVDFKNGACDANFGISGIALTYPIRWNITGSPNLVFCVDENLYCSSRSEEFYFSHLDVIYVDYTIPIETPATNLIATNCSLNTIPFEVDEDFNLYPNPAANTLNIHAKNTIAVISIALYNTLGQLILSIPNAIATDTIALDISNLKTGVYFVSVTTDKGKTTQRFIKK
jgi:uncharacterized protein YjbI with pentapeptide repeats